MFLKIPFISETLTVLLLGEGFGVFFFLGRVLSFGASTDSKLQKTVKKTPTSEFPKYLCLTLF